MDNERVISRKKKPTKTWCKGRVGIPHKWTAPVNIVDYAANTPQAYNAAEAQVFHNALYMGFMVQTCVTCGKKRYVDSTAK